VTNLVASLAENTTTETRIADLAVIDPDLASAFLDNAVTVDDARFEVRDGGLYLRAGQVVDFEAGTSIPLVLTVTSAAGTLTRPVTVTVGDVNEAATDLTVSNLVTSLAENTAAETRIADLAVIDPDLASAFRDNTVSVNDARFEVRDGALYLKAGQVVNFEAGSTIPLVLTVTSAAGTLTKPVTVTVGDVNEAATDLSVTNLVASLAENTTTETKVADLSVIDPDLASAFRDNAVSVNDARFEVRDGALYLKAGQVVNFEAGSTIPLVLTVTSAAGTLTRPVTVTVGDVNEAATALTVTNLIASLAENTATETKIADLAVVDPDVATAFRDNAVSVNDTRFEVKSGALYLKAGQVVDFEAGTTIALTLTVTSAAGTLQRNVTVTLSDVAEGPTGPFVLNRTGTTTALTVDLALASQTLADGTVLGAISQIDFRGGEGADTVYGGELADTLSGAGGADVLEGRGGADLITGGAGDTLRGGSGDDIVVLTGLASLADGGTGTDLLRVQASITPLASSITGFEAVELARSVTVNFSNLSDGMVFTGVATGTAGFTLTGTRGNDTITGTNGADTIDGSNGNDIIRGGDGADRITSGPGTDYLYGEGGDDSLESKRGTGPDHFDGGIGNDRATVDLAKSTMALTVDLTNPALLQFFGDGGSIVNVESINITGGTGADRFTGGALADTLNGWDGNDILRGAGGADTINGGLGQDLIEGGAGADILTGGTGERDTFVYSAAGFDADRITDFEVGLDVLDFRGSGLTSASATVTQVGANTVVSFGSAGSITLEGVLATSLNPADWLF
jgi:Ca2+-binding RTX toxin-like protein